MLAKAARDRKLGVMVGCMGGTSLAMAPSHVLAQICDFVDIDGPLLLRNDRLGGFVYEHGFASIPDTPFWGMPAK
jgi:L-alanine-DL-glutamate epimerase-like enolase superfamily enzyme